jgi:aminomethyltransferase
MTNKTSLYEKHTQLGAKMAPFAGFEMPIQYTSVKEEVLAVRHKVGVFDVGHMGEFFVTGTEAIKFVDHMMTNDFEGAELYKAVYSPLCRENGTVIDDFIAYKIDTQKVLVCVNAANIEKDYKWFEQHVTDFNCHLENHSAHYSLLALQGPESEKVLKKLEILPEGKFSYYSAKQIKAHGEDIILARTGYTGEDGFEIFCSHNYVQTLWDKMIDLGVTPCGLAARDVLRLEVCYPLYGHEIHDNVTPLDSALKWTVKLSKEDFLGKKALEEYSPKFRLVKLSLDKGIPREGYPILNEEKEEIGKICSGTMSVVLDKGIALGHVEKAKFPKDKKLFIKVRKNIIEANYHTKPFVNGGHK